MSTTRPRAADAIATSSHQPLFLKSPHVATVKPSSVTKASTWVMVHNTPLVETPRPAKAGVSHRYVVPNKNSATPPRLRIVNIEITSLLCVKSLWPLEATSPEELWRDDAGSIRARTAATRQPTLASHSRRPRQPECS